MGGAKKNGKRNKNVQNREEERKRGSLTKSGRNCHARMRSGKRVEGAMSESEKVKKRRGSVGVVDIQEQGSGVGLGDIGFWNMGNI